MISPKICHCIHPFFREYAPVFTPSSYCIRYSVINDTVISYFTKYTLCNEEVWKIEMTILSSCRLLPLFANLTFLSLLTRSSHFRPICSLLCISFPARDGKRRENILVFFSRLQLEKETHANHFCFDILVVL